MASMIPVAVVLIVLVIVFTIAIIIGNPQSFDLQIFVARIPANITGVYVTGAVTMIVLGLAGWLLWTGVLRMRARQKEIRTLKAAAGAHSKALGTKQATTGSTSSAGAKKTEAAESSAKPTRDPAATSSDRDRGSGTRSESGGGKDRPTERKPDTGDEKSSAGQGTGEPAGKEPAEERSGKDSAERNATDRGRRPESAEGPSTTPEERRRLLDEADELTRDDPST